MNISDFVDTVWNYYDAHGRHDLPWRKPDADGSFDPYKIMVSEIMLQQTQVGRVIPKYQEFLQQFPAVSALAKAPLADVLQAWSGLGYNRRAKFLWQAAQYVQHQCQGVFPRTVDELVALPGVGKNTAGAIATYAYQTAVPFIETNIRTVYIHHFFADHTDVSDAALLPYITQTLHERGDDRSPREWYWALMDYGAFLKKQGVGQIDRSEHYKKQAPLKGSVREVRGLILKQLAKQDLAEELLAERVPADERFQAALDALVKEGLVERSANRLHLAR